MFQPITIGTTRKGRRIPLPLHVRATHMQVIGASGTGKTKFLEHLIRQDILAENGLCLIDPTGNLYHDLVRWCETKGFLGRKKIALFDPAVEDWSFGFNPLDFGQDESKDVSFFVDSMVKACAQVWGGEDTDKTPLLKRCLRNTFHALVENGLTLLEAVDLIQPGESPLRTRLTATLRDPIARTDWEGFRKMRRHEFTEHFRSTTNRLMEFLASERIRRILGQQRRTLRFRTLMDEGYAVLVNLSSGRDVSEDNARLLGTLMLNDLFRKARGRAKAKRCRPFYVYVDECSRFINEDIQRILDEGRQFGLHLILAHQHLAQLKRAGEAVYGAVMTDARTKVVFGGLSPEDAKIMAEVVFMGEINLEEEKRSLSKPVVIGNEVIWLENYTSSVTTGRTEGEGNGWSETRSQNDSDSVTYRDEWFLREELSRTTGSGSSFGTSTSRSSSWSETETHSDGSGMSQSLAPIYKELPTAVFSLEEQIHKAAARLRNLPSQRAVVKIPDRWSVGIRAMAVEPGYARDERVERFREEAFRRTPFASPTHEVAAELAARRERLEAMVRPPSPDPETPEDFLE